MYSRYSLALRQFSAAANQNRVGFYGLGNMGLHMASNLKKNGFEVKAFDISPESRQAGADAGIEVHDNVAEVAKNVDFIVSALPRTEHVDELLNGENGVFKNASEGTKILDASTISPDGSKRFAEQAKDYGMVFADIPMSGGIFGAEAGTLTFMIGCEEEHYDSIMPALKAMGANFFHCGGPGMGEVAKLCNNLSLGVNMVATAEAMALGKKLGIDDKILFDIVSVSSGASKSLTQYSPVPGIKEGVPSARDYEGGFGTALILKDMRLALDAAKEADQTVELTEKAVDYYKTMDNKGFGKKDFSFVYQYVVKNYEI